MDDPQVFFKAENKNSKSSCTNTRSASFFQSYEQRPKPWRWCIRSLLGNLDIHVLVGICALGLFLFMKIMLFLPILGLSADITAFLVFAAVTLFV